MGGTLVPVVVFFVKDGDGRCLNVLGTVYANHMLRGVDGVAAWAGVCWSIIRVVAVAVHVYIITPPQGHTRVILFLFEDSSK